jgi:hypothetical protein
MPYFALSILQNIVVGWLVFIFTQQLFKRTRVSLFAGLIATIAFPSIQVVTWITGSTVSLLACFYLVTAIIFVQYLKTRSKGWYAGFLVSFFVATFMYEYAISLLAVLALLGFGLSKEYQVPLKRMAWILAPCLAILIPYGILEVQLIQQGTSEAMAGYSSGLQIFPAFLNLSHLLMPDLHFPRLVNFLTSYFPIGLQILQILAPVATIIWIGITLYILVRGTARTRILILWTYLAFAPFTLWSNPDTIHSSRYLYLPMIAFAILLAVFIDWAGQHLGQRTGKMLLASSLLLGAWLLYNVAPIAIFESQEVAKGGVRRAIVEQIQELHPSFTAGSTIYIGVPD